MKKMSYLHCGPCLCKYRPNSYLEVVKRHACSLQKEENATDSFQCEISGSCLEIQ